MMAVTLGANAAMEIGNTGKALKFYASVLKYDPEQKEVRLQHRGLKKVVKLLKKADEQLEKGCVRACEGGREGGHFFALQFRASPVQYQARGRRQTCTGDPGLVRPTAASLPSWAPPHSVAGAGQPRPNPAPTPARN